MPAHARESKPFGQCHAVQAQHQIHAPFHDGAAAVGRHVNPFTPYRREQRIALGKCVVTAASHEIMSFTAHVFLVPLMVRSSKWMPTFARLAVSATDFSGAVVVASSMNSPGLPVSNKFSWLGTTFFTMAEVGSKKISTSTCPGTCSGEDTFFAPSLIAVATHAGSVSCAITGNPASIKCFDKLLPINPTPRKPMRCWLSFIPFDYL